MATSKVTERALNIVKNMPRVALGNVRDFPERKVGVKMRKKKRGRGDKGQGARNTWDPLGYEGGQQPLINNIPSEKYYGLYAQRRQYPPISLLELQRCIDLNRVDVNRPIDITAVCNTRLFNFDVLKGHFGIHLTEEGCDNFATQINLEVQWTTELAIAAVESCGGTITTRYYDPLCLAAVFDPLEFFKKGLPIPKCKLPPQDALEYYSNPKFRGYLADPEAIFEERVKLAQKYGYKLPQLDEDDAKKQMLLMRKDPLQIFYGLHPGWVVNLNEKCILKPKDPDYERYYNNAY